MTSLTQPRAITFDVFGTLVDWRLGLSRDLEPAGVQLDEGRWENTLAEQERLEQGPFRSYAEITTWSLIRRLGLPRALAERIGSGLGRWPPYADTATALRELMTHAPCIAMTNSDHAHGRQMQEELGFNLSAWFCAEEVRVYKPSRAFWENVGDRLQLDFDPSWWHVSAYADYDLAAAAALGLTTVLVERPHCRPGPADLKVKDLAALAEQVRRGDRGDS